ncbi:SagB/ThcOx family dehydrogenase [Bacillus sp. DJP31]|uniref:SagB/ThcOx family dehydrogenase n=1 Tax=Bacillus sp. DJP31 TaxID=3409789 RepID=UPI003BB58134
MHNRKSFQIFHDNSKNAHVTLGNQTLTNPKNWPKEWTEVEEKTHPRLLNIELSKDDVSVEMKLIDAIHLRSSCKTNSSDQPLALKDLSTLIRNSVSFRKPHQTKDLNIGRRVYPSAGARFPLECYIIVNNIVGLEKGLYHYELSKESLALLFHKNLEREIKEIFGEDLVHSRAIIILTSVMNRNIMKYGERGYRFALIEAGHLMQNICLLSTAMNIPMAPIGGFVDVLVSRLLDLEETREIPLYSCVLP